jgi:hypothetical protein
VITRQFILEVWERMETDTVGSVEISRIQEAMAESLSADSRDLIQISPASIARILADEGACLRHPEILEADVRWRERQEMIGLPGELNESSLIQLLVSLIERFQSGESENKESAQKHTRQMALKLKGEFELIAAHRNDLDGEFAKEGAQWLQVFLETPEIARDWVALRTETPEYKDLMRRFDELAKLNVTPGPESTP